MKLVFLVIVLISTIAYANPSLSYLDDMYEYNGKNSISIIEIIFNTIIFALFFLYIFYGQFKEWKKNNLQKKYLYFVPFIFKESIKFIIGLLWEMKFIIAIFIVFYLLYN
ncbi:MAG: hypothetical protein AB7D43_03060 [Sulfurimonadaceae bacterium]